MTPSIGSGYHGQHPPSRVGRDCQWAQGDLCLRLLTLEVLQGFEVNRLEVSFFVRNRR